MHGFRQLCQRLLSPQVWQFSAAVAMTIALTGSIEVAKADASRSEFRTNFSVTTPATRPILAQFPIDNFPGILIFLIVGGTLVCIPLFFGGLTTIGEGEVGIVVRKFTLSGKGLPPTRLVALDGEAGIQADTLAPGWHWGYFPWQYQVRKEKVVVIPQSEIALVVAADGAAIPSERILGKIVDCDNFQDARKFLTQGGEKGRQLGLLTAGTYRINTALFKVITADTAERNGMTPAQLRVYQVSADKVGIVTTLDGMPIKPGEIAGTVIEGHDNFQNTQKFLNAGGSRGLQEQTLLSGSWNLNPWFVQVEQIPMTEIPIGYVGVVISFVGEAHVDVSGASFTHGNLVNPGHKGVWIEPLYPGKHPLNTRIMKVELVPTTNIVLNWSDRTERHSYDSSLASLNVRSKDGFSFVLQIAQIIHVAATNAPKVISRVGSMQNLVDHVLEPTIGNYFRNSAQDYTVLDFLSARSDRQLEAAEYIRKAILNYDVSAIDTLIGDVRPPEALMETQTDRKIAQEQEKTYEVQKMAQTQRQQLVRETALANIQQEMVKSEQSVKIAELEASAQVQKATGEAESIKLRAIGEAEGIRATGSAKAETYSAGVAALGEQGYTAMQLMQIIGDRRVRLIPDVMVGGNNGGGNGLVDGLLSMILWNQTGHKIDSASPNGSAPGEESTASSPTLDLPTPPLPDRNPLPDMKITYPIMADRSDDRT
jgi:uncharacterized membrane protein YqiK